MPRLVYSTGEENEGEPRTVYMSLAPSSLPAPYSRSIATCPACDLVATVEAIEPQTDELGVSWFRCRCGHVFSLGGLYQKVEVR
jgi:hypothetical protein